jgi:hypothetical protein
VTSIEQVTEMVEWALPGYRLLAVADYGDDDIHVVFVAPKNLPFVEPHDARCVIVSAREKRILDRDA